MKFLILSVLSLFLVGCGPDRLLVPHVEIPPTQVRRSETWFNVGNTSYYHSQGEHRYADQQIGYYGEPIVSYSRDTWNTTTTSEYKSNAPWGGGYQRYPTVNAPVVYPQGGSGYVPMRPPTPSWR